MATVTAAQVNELRNLTGAGLMDCKKALTEANGDVQAAIDFLRKKGAKVAELRAGRAAAEGVVIAKTSADNKKGVAVYLSCESDFVAKNDSFVKFATDVAELALEKAPATLEALLELDLNGSTVKAQVQEKVSAIGELINVSAYETIAGESVVAYNHMGNKIGVLVKLNNSGSTNTVEIEELAKNIAMHVAAAQPQAEYIDKTKIPSEILENERRIELGKEDLAKKPKEIAEKIVQGRLDKILSQRCLLDQPYIKDQTITIEKLIKDKSKQLNTDIHVVQFVRYNVGETIEKSSSLDHKTTVSIS